MRGEQAGTVLRGGRRALHCIDPLYQQLRSKPSSRACSRCQGARQSLAAPGRPASASSARSAPALPSVLGRLSRCFQATKVPASSRLGRRGSSHAGPPTSRRTRATARLRPPLLLLVLLSPFARLASTRTRSVPTRCSMAPSPRLGAYSLLSSTPTDAESSSTAYQEKAAHSRAHSRTASFGGPRASGASAAGPGRQPAGWRRLATKASLAAAAVGLVVWLARPLAIPEQDVQLSARHKIAYDFETGDVPSEWRCNPFKEPGRLQVDVDTPVRRSPTRLSCPARRRAQADAVLAPRAQSKNIWRPYEDACPPSRMMLGLNKSIEALRQRPDALRQRGPSRSHDTTLRQLRDEGDVPFYPWFENATILLLGALTSLSLSLSCTASLCRFSS